jgi:hypothetical protein
VALEIYRQTDNPTTGATTVKERVVALVRLTLPVKLPAAAIYDSAPIVGDVPVILINVAVFVARVCATEVTYPTHSMYGDAPDVFFRNNPISSKELNAGVDLGRYPVTVTVVVPEALIVFGAVEFAYANGAEVAETGDGSLKTSDAPVVKAYETMPIKSPVVLFHKALPCSVAALIVPAV